MAPILSLTTVSRMAYVILNKLQLDTTQVALMEFTALTAQMYVRLTGSQVGREGFPLSPAAGMRRHRWHQKASEGI